MPDIPSLPKLFGFALIAFAAIAPMAYCTVHEQASKDSVRRACIEAKGTIRGWGGCDLPKTETAKSN